MNVARRGFEAAQVFVDWLIGKSPEMANPASGKQVIVAYHRGRVLPLGTMKSIMDGSGIPMSDWTG